MMDHDYTLHSCVQNPDVRSIESACALPDAVIPDHDYNFMPAEGASKEVFQCYVCNSVLKHRQSLYKHLKNVHKLQPSGSKQNLIKCLENNCSAQFSNSNALRIHLRDVHEQKIECEKISFKTLADSNIWKDDLEQKKKVQYVKDTGCHLTADETTRIYYYRCNRTGKYRDNTKGNRKRRLKSQGSDKINSHCTSCIFIHEPVNKESQIQVTYYKTHYGHSIDLAHIKLPEAQKNQIATWIKDGVSKNKILDKIRDSVSVDEFERIHLTTKKNIQRIEQVYGLDSQVQKDRNDRLSVDIWVEENKDDCVIYVKRQGEEDSTLRLLRNDFALAIQNSAMSHILKKFGENSIVCMDATHGTNPYDFLLVTIMVVDDFGEGFPVAFFYSNHEDENSLRIFFEAVKVKSGVINCSVFMSDDANQYYNAWVGVMGGNPKKLLCTWHVDRAWKGKLNLIADVKKQQDIYKDLKVLHYEREESTFLELLSGLKNKFSSDPDLSEFGNYFNSTYATRCENWAYCYRKKSGINTNMYLEAMHRTLKHVYFEGLKIRRLDRSIHTLMKLVRDKQFERVIKLVKGKNAGRLRNMQDRHVRAMKLPLSAVRELSQESWLVSSQQNCSEDYKVEKNEFLEENHSCFLICKECSICIHRFSCECPDNVIKTEMCKHIHLVAKFLKEKEYIPQVGVDVAQISPVIHEQELQVHLETLAKEKNTLPVSCKKQKLLCTMQRFCKELEEEEENDNDELYNILQEHCNTMENIMKLRKRNRESKDTMREDIPPNKEPPNKKIALQNPQRKFFSTKKKRISQKENRSLTKPDFFEREEIKNSLRTSSVLSQTQNL